MVSLWKCLVEKAFKLHDDKRVPHSEISSASEGKDGADLIYIATCCSIACTCPFYAQRGLIGAKILAVFKKGYLQLNAMKHMGWIVKKQNKSIVKIALDYLDWYYFSSIVIFSFTLFSYIIDSLSSFFTSLQAA